MITLEKWYSHKTGVRGKKNKRKSIWKDDKLFRSNQLLRIQSRGHQS